MIAGMDVSAVKKNKIIPRRLRKECRGGRDGEDASDCFPFP